MLVIGLTGSIGTGKSTVAMLLEREKIPVHDADECVHKLLAHDEEAIQDVGKLFPPALQNGRIDRKILRELVLEDPQKIRDLEEILHPKVEKSQQQFINYHRQQNEEEFIVLEIPLLYERGYEKLCDSVVVVTCSQKEQKKRLKQRSNISEDHVEKLLAMQWPNDWKVNQADYVIDTEGPMSHTMVQLEAVFEDILSKTLD